MSKGEKYYKFGIELFEDGCYETAVEYLIQAYNLGYEREQILKNIYDCFILPNQEEFRNSFIQDREGITQISLEACAIDFIPVSEKKFYLFDKEEGVFKGNFELEDVPVQGEKEEFGSILFADIWDIREMVPELKKKKWDAVYIVLNEAERKFASFLKIPKFRERHLANAAVFQNTELWQDVFEQYEEFYLPKNITAVEVEPYLGLFHKIHKKRLDSRKERKNVFLSVCIPSYNRGSVALKNVQNLLQCVYDSEIEIIVSNNGSEENTEGYQEIKAIQDSRLVYHEFETNQGFASNVMKVLDLAKGKYAVLLSDEDRMLLEHLGEYFTCLKANPKCGIFWESGRGVEFEFWKVTEDTVYPAGGEAVEMVMLRNYVTGITFQMKLLKECHAFERIEGMRGNVFLEYYPHIPLMMMAGMYTELYWMKLPLWDATSTEYVDNTVCRYMLPEIRIAQQNGAVDFCYRGIGLSKYEIVRIFVIRSIKTYDLLGAAYQIDRFRELYSWEELCFFIYKEHEKYLKEFPADLDWEDEMRIRKDLQKMFFNSLKSERIIRIYPQEEQKKKKMIYQQIEKEFKEGKAIEEVEMIIKGEYLKEKEQGIQEKTDITDTFVVENRT